MMKRHCHQDDCTAVLGDAVLIVIGTNASCKELKELSLVSRRFRDIATHDALWQLRAHDILHEEDAATAKAALRLGTYRQLVEAFGRIGIPCGVLGLWKADLPVPPRDAGMKSPHRLPTSVQDMAVQEAEAQGELLRITLNAGGFLCQSMSANGSTKSIFAIRVSCVQDRVRVGFFALEDNSLSNNASHGWVPGRPIEETFSSPTSPVPSAQESTPLRACGSSFTFHRANGRRCRYSKIQPPMPSDASELSSTPSAVVAQMRGLWRASYGSHGIEVINLSVDTVAKSAAPETSWSAESSVAPNISEWCTKDMSGGESASTSALTDTDDAYSSDSNSSIDEDDLRLVSPVDDFKLDYNCDGGPQEMSEMTSPSRRRSKCDAAGDVSVNVVETEMRTLLVGTKVTGDVNVPTGKVSFQVDVSTVCDVDQELDADRRPVVLFLPGGAVMTDLSNRRSSILFWCKGRGQINRVPGYWCPEWVDVDFIVYHVGGRCAFSVLFMQRDEVVRVIMDFERVLDAEDAWPRWGTADVHV